MRVALIAQVPARFVARRRAVAGLLLILCSGVAPALAQSGHEIRGRVLDAASAVPIPFVEIWLVRDRQVMKSEYAVTNEDGRFSLHADRAAHLALYARRIGYSPVVTLLDSLAKIDSFGVEIRLASVAVSLPTANVTGRNNLRDILLSGFDHRRELGLGAFITYDEIQRKGAPALSSLLREIPGVEVRGTGPGMQVRMGRSSQMLQCEPLVYMDGQRATRSSDPPSVVGELLAGTPGTALEAVEVYRGRSELPAEFADPDARCGAIVIWTRRPSLHELPSKKHPSPRR